MSSPLNPINVRLPQFDLTTEDGRQAAHRYVASGIVDLNQAIAALNDKVNVAKSTITTIIQGGSGGGGGGGSVVGGVNDQLGQAAYTTQQSDNGAKIIVGDSSPVTVTLDTAVTTPWFTIIDNDSSSVASLSGPVVGAQAIYPGGFAVIYFDGATFWSGAAQIATDSSLGVVQPDNTTIKVDSSGVISAVGMGPSYADNESPTGSGLSWFLAHSPNPPASLELFSWLSGFGAVLLVQGRDYTLSGSSITITASYTIGSLYAFYRY